MQTSALALLSLLALPGFTNALLFAMGVAGRRRALAAPLAVLAGYIAAIGLIGGILGPAVAQSPPLARALRGLGGAYLLFQALRLWRAPGLGITAAAPTLSALFLTTLGNPKAIIIALVLLPPGWAQELDRALPALTLLAAKILVVSLLWLGLGLALRASLARLGQSEGLACRLSAVVMALFAGALLITALAP